jgi:hypothetical protein
VNEGKKQGCVPLRITLPLANQITRADTEERALRLRRYRLCKVTLPRTWGPVKQDTPPRCALAREQMGEFNRKDDSLLQRLFGDLEPRDVIPANVRLVDEDRTRKTGAELFHFRILVAILIVLPEFPPRIAWSVLSQYTIKSGRGNSLLALSTGPTIRHPIRSYRSSRALFADLRNVFFELFGTAEVFPNLGLDQDFRPLVLLICMFDSDILLALQQQWEGGQTNI